MNPWRRGALAGLVGTLLLDAATYVDMAVTGRPASRVPAEAVRRTAHLVGLDPSADDPRLTTYGALGGLGTGVGIGVLVSLLRAAGVRLPAPLGAVAAGALAMAATDVPLAAAGITDPRTWSRSDWARDVVPHLAFGAGVRVVMDAVDRRWPPHAGGGGGYGAGMTQSPNDHDQDSEPTTPDGEEPAVTHLDDPDAAPASDPDPQPGDA